MRDNILIFLILVAILLMVILAGHIAHCFDVGKNWFTTPLFGEFAHNAGLSNLEQTHMSLPWIV